MKNRLVMIVVALVSVLAFAVPATAQEGQLFTHVRVAHFSPDTPPVVVFLNGELSNVQVLSYGEVSGWVELPAGTYSVAVAPAGGNLEDAAIGPANFRLAPGAWVTVAAVGSLGEGTLRAATVAEDYSPIDAGEARVTVFHGIADAPAVDVILADGTPLVSNLSFGNGSSLTVPAGVYDLQVVAAGTTGPAVLNLPGVALDAETFYLVSAVNTLANPGVNVQAVAESVVAPLFGKIFSSRTIVDIAVADGRFSTLVTALQLTGLDSVLATSGPFTVFAPTNAAFAALPAGVLDSLIADTDALAQVLRYHVVVGTAPAAAITEVGSLNTLNGSLSVTVTDEGRVFLNGNVEIIITDIVAQNGLIHVIDAVLVP